MRKAFLLWMFSSIVFITENVRAGDTTAARPKNVTEITSLRDCKLPEEMFQRIKHMKPKDISELKEELQQPIRDDDGEKLLTIKLRYYADHIIGIIKEAPFTQTNWETVKDKRINIPVKWVCTPDSMGHEPHAVLMSEMKDYEINYHCKNWKQEEEENDEMMFGKPEDAIPVKKKKKKFIIF